MKTLKNNKSPPVRQMRISYWHISGYFALIMLKTTLFRKSFRLDTGDLRTTIKPEKVK
jgi:hypothetical protein